jgi:WD40 repeat protein
MSVPRCAAILLFVLLGAAPCLAAGPPGFRYDGDGNPLPPGAVARLGTLRMFHPGWVRFKGFTPDCRCLITCSCNPVGVPDLEENLFWVWDLRTGKLVRRFGHTGGGAYRAAQSPDRRWIVSAGETGSFLWDAQTGQLVRQVEKWETAEQRPRGSYVLALTNEKIMIRLIQPWIETVNLTSGRTQRVRFCDDDESIYGGEPYQFSPDGRTLIRLHQVLVTATGKPRGQFAPGVGDFLVTFYPDVKVFAVCDPSTGAMQIRDTVTLKLLRQWGPEKGLEFDCIFGRPPHAFSPVGNLLAAPSGRQSIGLWDWTTGKFIRRVEASDIPFEEVIFTPDGKSLVSLGRLSRNRLWDVATGKELLRFEGHHKSIHSIRYIGKDALLATGDGSGVSPSTSIIWNTRTGRVVETMPDRIVDPKAICADGKLLAVANSDGTVVLRDRGSGMVRRLLGVSLQHPPLDPNNQHAYRDTPGVAFSSEGTMLACTSPGGAIRLWRTDTGEECGRLGAEEPARAAATSLTFSGRQVASGAASCYRARCGYLEYKKSSTCAVGAPSDESGQFSGRSVASLRRVPGIYRGQQGSGLRWARNPAPVVGHREWGVTSPYPA